MAEIVRVRGFQVREDGDGVVDRIVARSTAPRLQDTTRHRIVRPRAVTGTPAAGDGYFWLDLLDTGPSLAPEGRRWEITFYAGVRAVRRFWIEVPPGAPLVGFGDDGRPDPQGPLQPARWITDLDDFADEVGGPPIGSLANYVTKAALARALEDTGHGGGARDLADLRDVQGADDARPGDALYRGTSAWAPEPAVYAFTQATPIKTWLILHQLSRTPSHVLVRADQEGGDGRQLYPLRVTHPAPGRTRIDWPVPVAGVAYL